MATTTAELPGDLISCADAATIAGVAVKTVRSWAERGRIRSWKIAGAAVRVSRAEIENLVVERPSTRSPQTPPGGDATATGKVPIDVIQRMYSRGYIGREEYVRRMAASGHGSNNAAHGTCSESSPRPGKSPSR